MSTDRQQLTIKFTDPVNGNDVIVLIRFADGRAALSLTIETVEDDLDIVMCRSDCEHIVDALHRGFSAEFTDLDSQSGATVYLRHIDDGIALGFRIDKDGDIDLFFSRDDFERLLQALQRAAAGSEIPQILLDFAYPGTEYRTLASLRGNQGKIAVGFRVLSESAFDVGMSNFDYGRLIDALEQAVGNSGVPSIRLEFIDLNTETIAYIFIRPAMDNISLELMIELSYNMEFNITRLDGERLIETLQRTVAGRDIFQ